SGLVKGWAIQEAAAYLRARGLANFYVEAGGDVQTYGLNTQGKPWAVGIRNPFNWGEIIKVIHLSGWAVATSGTYVRGPHIYNPLVRKRVQSIQSLTIIGPNIYDADRLATAAFAMGERGIGFIENQPGFEGYMVDNSKVATFTSGFSGYVRQPA